MKRLTQVMVLYILYHTGFLIIWYTSMYQLDVLIMAIDTMRINLQDKEDRGLVRYIQMVNYIQGDMVRGVDWFVINIEGVICRGDNNLGDGKLKTQAQ